MVDNPGILIAGAGPTGLTLACELLRRGVPCRLIDQAAGPLERSRAIGLSTRSLEVLDGFGAADHAVELGHQLRAANFYSRGGRIASVSTDGLSHTKFPFILSSPQNNTEQVLTTALTRLGGVVERGTKLTGLTQPAGPGTVSVVLEGPAGRELTEADWVIGADGAHSAVRKLSGISFDGAATNVEFVIVDAAVEIAPPRGTAHYYFSADGLLVAIPLPDGGYRFAATVRPGETGDDLDLDFVQSMVDRRTRGRGTILTELRDAGWGAARVRIHNRLADRFRSGRCLLAGDAAHIHSPVGGQGVNIGVQDAHNLGWKLAMVATGQAGPALLDSYEAERRPVAVAVAAAVDKQTTAAAMRSPIKAKLRDIVLSRSSARGTLAKTMVPMLAQLAVNYAGSPAVAADDAPTLGGTRLPDTPLAGPTGTPDTAHGLLRETPFTLLVLAGAGLSTSQTAQVAALDADLAARHPGLVGVRTLLRGEASADAITDTGGALHHHLGAATDTGGALHDHLGATTDARLCLVRPDGHIVLLDGLAPTTSVPAVLDRVLTRARASELSAIPEH
jgi:2-polyprenyl-6-methoxyphenol hydroxylase-like FAD-dependent oxidoreductase